MTIENQNEVEGLKRIGHIVAQTLRYMQEQCRPGMSTRELDELGRKFLSSFGARSAPQITYNFPGTTCISVNEEVAHGIPGDRILRDGDLINIDVSAELDGFFADTGGSFVLNDQNSPYHILLKATKKALNQAINALAVGRPFNIIGKNVEKVARRYGLTVIENLGSHGVGKALHEEPEFIAGFYDSKDKRKIQEGQVFTIEPFLSNGATWVEELSDGWTLAAKKGFRVAQFEHTIAMIKGRPHIMTI